MKMIDNGLKPGDTFWLKCKVKENGHFVATDRNLPLLLATESKDWGVHSSWLLPEDIKDIQTPREKYTDFSGEYEILNPYEKIQPGDIVCLKDGQRIEAKKDGLVNLPACYGIEHGKYTGRVFRKI